MIATLVQYERTKPACIQASALSMVGRCIRMVLVCFRCRFLPELGCLVALVCRDGLLVCRDPENGRDFWLMQFFLFFFGFDVGPL